MKLRLGDIAQGGVIRQRSTLAQQKTGRPAPFEITEAATEALAHWLEGHGGTTGSSAAAAEKEST